MADIFLSYAREDDELASRLEVALRAEGWSVFRDTRIDLGGKWVEQLLRELERARCVIVLWSQAARTSFWVVAEAARAHECGTYLPVCLDGSEPPELFAHLQAFSLGRWADGDDAPLSVLLDQVRGRLGDLPMYGNLDPVNEGEPITEAHLHLVHSCWRVDKETAHGRMPYQIHVVVFGHPSALDRVESVEYLLPGIPSRTRAAAGAFARGVLWADGAGQRFLRGAGVGSGVGRVAH